MAQKAVLALLVATLLVTPGHAYAEGGGYEGWAENWPDGWFYEAQHGDSLWGIAHGLRYPGGLQGLLEYNPLFKPNPRLIHPGDNIWVPPEVQKPPNCRTIWHPARKRGNPRVGPPSYVEARVCH